jgi:hypothetical protein
MLARSFPFTVTPTGPGGVATFRSSRTCNDTQAAESLTRDIDDDRHDFFLGKATGWWAPPHINGPRRCTRVEEDPKAVSDLHRAAR